MGQVARRRWMCGVRITVNTDEGRERQSPSVRSPPIMAQPAISRCHPIATTSPTASPRLDPKEAADDLRTHQATSIASVFPIKLSGPVSGGRNKQLYVAPSQTESKSSRAKPSQAIEGRDISVRSTRSAARRKGRTYKSSIELMDKRRA
jgi:hypothetical protein